MLHIWIENNFYTFDTDFNGLPLEFKVEFEHDIYPGCIEYETNGNIESISWNLKNATFNKKNNVQIVYIDGNISLCFYCDNIQYKYKYIQLIRELYIKNNTILPKYIFEIKQDNIFYNIDYEINGNICLFNKKICYTIEEQKSDTYYTKSSCTIHFYPSGNIKDKCYQYKYSKFHCATGPAIIKYKESGKIYKELYYLFGKLYSYNAYIKTPEGQSVLKKQAINLFN